MIRIIFSLISLFFIAQNSHAEFHCSAEVRYKWLPDSGALVQESKKQPSANGDEKKDSVVESSGPVAKEVYWGAVEALGADEAAAKSKLTEVANKERTKADASCREAHENQTKCIAGKYAQNASVLSLMSFTQRREMEKTILSDCANSTGRCAGSSVSDAVCKEVKKEGETEATPADEKKGKDAKKK